MRYWSGSASRGSRRRIRTRCRTVRSGGSPSRAPSSPARRCDRVRRITGGALPAPRSGALRAGASAGSGRVRASPRARSNDPAADRTRRGARRARRAGGGTDVTFLARRDPTVKLAVVLGISLLLILIVDPVTPALFPAVALAVALAGA